LRESRQIRAANFEKVLHLTMAVSSRNGESMPVGETSSRELQLRRKRYRLAIVSTHPIQYYAPWFRHLAAREELQLRVFFLLDVSANGAFDRGFKQEVSWDIPLLAGYEYEFVPNESEDPGTHHFSGLKNPSLRARVKEFVPDAVLLVGYNYWSLIRFILFWPAGNIPLLLRGDSHRLVVRYSVKERIKAGLLRLLFSRFSAFLYVGQANRNYFEVHGARPSSLFRGPHAVDNERFMANAALTKEAATHWRRGLGIGDDRVVILFAGKFEAKKRPLDLLRAFRQLRPGKAVLLFVGAGELEGQLRSEAGANRDVFFAPFQNQSQMPRTYAACDLFVLPSYGPFETWGLAVNEAMCLGKPVLVSSHVGCAQDLVIPDRTGLVFEAGRVDELAKALESAVQNPARLQEWGERARSHISGFSYQAATHGLLRAIEHVMISRWA
jgi:glycosyltransferase involved in cell wall biosynthesis